MRDPAPLPRELQDRPFLTTEAFALGVPHWRLRRSDLVSGGQGIWCPASRPLTFEERVAVQQRAMSDAVISHVTAARLHGLWLPPRLQESDEIHLTRAHNCQQTRRPDVHGHASRIDSTQIRTVQGIPATSPGRTWVDLAGELTDEELIIIGDQLLRLPWTPRGRTTPFHTADELSELVDRNECRPGLRRIRDALQALRVGSDSPSETRMRLAIVRAGLPEPELQIRLDPSDRSSPEADLGYRRQRVAVQYDGAHHLTADQQSRDIERDESWLRAGWTCLRAGRVEQRRGFVGLILRLRGLIAHAEMNAQRLPERA